MIKKTGRFAILEQFLADKPPNYLDKLSEEHERRQAEHRAEKLAYGNTSKVKSRKN